jgi:acetate kinase
MHRSKEANSRGFLAWVSSVMRYGFHGLSYDYIAPKEAKGTTVVLHQGNGASMCAVEAGQSRASTMGFTAVEVFLYRIRRELGSLAAALGGIDALVFTAGIGENAPVIRSRVCGDASWLGVEMDEVANSAGQRCISTASSRVTVRVIPTNEELMIAHHTRCLLE